MSTWEEVHAFSRPMTIPLQGQILTATPMRFAKVLRTNDKGVRELVPMRWGFAAANAGQPARPKHMHARCETIDRLPTFAESFAHRRGILMAATFNEGETLANGKTKQWVITPKDGQPIAIAVIWEEWINGPETLATFVMVTTPPNALIARVTDRMPAILRDEDWPAWLGETDASLDEIKALLRTFDDEGAWTMREQEPKKKPDPNRQPDMF